EPLRDVVRQVPLEKILVETDSPYLTPVPHRGKRNEPAYARLVAEAMAKIKAVSLEEVAQITTDNVGNLFKI
ncbi:MAG TPA: TatD family hydrolase, partial [Candidatus Nitrosocosmicus sp.]|nr:TatD family hydrolase [Candidatus Nitrosocosmicus sp.]